MSTAEASGVTDTVHAAPGAAGAIGTPTESAAPSWVARARNSLHFVSALARMGRQSPALRRWYAGNRLRQLTVAAQCALRADGVSSPPRTVSLRVTYLCNARCKMCHYANTVDPDNGRPITSRDEVIELELALRLVDELARSYTMLNITGGEPLLWGEPLFEVIDHARRRGIPITITTNGTLLGRHLDRLMQSPPDVLCVSILGPPRTHDRIVGLPAFGRIRDALTELLARKGGDRWLAPVVLTNTVMLPENAEVFAEVVGHAQGLGACGSSFQPLWFATGETHEACDDVGGAADAAVASAATNLAPRTAPADALWHGMQRARKLSAQLAHPVFFYPRLSQRDANTYYERPEQALGRSRALCAHLLCSVLPDGTVSPCPGFAVGDLRQSSFTQIWNGEHMREFRKRLRGAGKLPICARCCSLWRYE